MTRSLPWSRVVLAWVAMMGVDLLFHAGVFAAVFDQSREPSLLADDVLFRRIPIAYATLFIGAVALGWILERADISRMDALRVGAASGLVVGVMGLGAVWTAVDITGLLVLAGTVVLIAQGITAAGVLMSSMRTRALSLRVAGFVVACLVIGQIAANVIG